jgi:hypothetical protein
MGTAFGSPFFCLLFFGEAKKSKACGRQQAGQSAKTGIENPYPIASLSSAYLSKTK